MATSGDTELRTYYEAVLKMLERVAREERAGRGGSRAWYTGYWTPPNSRGIHRGRRRQVQQIGLDRTSNWRASDGPPFGQSFVG